MTPGVFTIFQGNAKTMYLRAMNAGCNTDPLDLTSCTEIDIALPNSDGSFTHYLFSDGDVVISTPKNLGKFSVAISAVLSLLMLPGEIQSFDVTFTIGAEVFTVRYSQSLSVFQQG